MACSPFWRASRFSHLIEYDLGERNGGAGRLGDEILQICSVDRVHDDFEEDRTFISPLREIYCTCTDAV